VCAVHGSRCFFVSDLHGVSNRYHRLAAAIADERPKAVFLGGDLLPHHWGAVLDGRASDEPLVISVFRELSATMGAAYPRVFVILGNDDARVNEKFMREAEAGGLWSYCHNRCMELDGHPVLGYAMVPPTPFQLKDWELYDVSRYTDPGCVSPEQGARTVAVEPDEVRYRTIAADLDRLTESRDLGRAVLMFHSPPYATPLDRAALDGKMIDHAPLDVHVGSIAIQRLIEDRQPLLTLHGHIHEAPRLTGTWRTMIGRTHCFTAAHDGPELALIRFDLDDLDAATRELL
jgi:Icc-related predicted phosphoesterase